MRSYIALIHKDVGSDFGVSFPDLPGCITAGTTLEEARRMAAEALAFHLEGLTEDGEAVPEPSSLDDIMADRSNRDAVAFLVEAPSTVDPIVRVNITVPESALDVIDKAAKSAGMSRSSFMVSASSVVARNAASGRSRAGKAATSRKKARA